MQRDQSRRLTQDQSSSELPSHDHDSEKKPKKSVRKKSAWNPNPDCLFVCLNFLSLKLNFWVVIQLVTISSSSDANWTHNCVSSRVHAAPPQRPFLCLYYFWLNWPSLSQRSVLCSGTHLELCSQGCFTVSSQDGFPSSLCHLMNHFKCERGKGCVFTAHSITKITAVLFLLD